jgi:hypothetical protein
MKYTSFYHCLYKRVALRALQWGSRNQLASQVSARAASSASISTAAFCSSFDSIER